MNSKFSLASFLRSDKGIALAIAIGVMLLRAVLFTTAFDVTNSGSSPNAALTVLRAHHWFSEGGADGLYLSFLIKLLATTFGSTVAAFEAISIVASGIAVYLFYQCFDSKRMSVVATLLLATNLSFLYNGTFLATASFTTVFAVGLLYALVNKSSGARPVLVASVLYGCSIGISLLSFLLLLPLYVYVLIRHRSLGKLSNHELKHCIGLWLTSVICWLACVFFLVGGSFNQIWSSLFPYKDLWEAVGLLLFAINGILLLRIGRRTAKHYGDAFVWVGIGVPFVLLIVFETAQANISILIPVLIFVWLNWYESKSVWLFSIIIIGVNLALFFALPSVRPSNELNLAWRLRTQSETQLALSRVLSYDMPSYAHHRDQQQGMNEAAVLIHQVPLSDSSLILIDNSTSYWINEQAMKVMIPEREFVRYDGRHLHRAGGSDPPFVEVLEKEPHLYLLAEKKFGEDRFDSLLSSYSALHKQSERFVMYDIPLAARKDFIDQLLALYYNSMHAFFGG